MKWKDIESAPLNKPILVKYCKGRKNGRTHVSGEYIVTQAIGLPIYKHTYVEHQHPYSLHIVRGYTICGRNDIPYDNEWEVELTSHVEWLDGLERLICNTSTKTQKNFVEYWMEIPEGYEESPEDEEYRNSIPGLETYSPGYD